jgi:DNA-binding transcriptional ArsR family regulator
VKRTERLFALAEYLRGRRSGVTAEALAERFDVTIRTIYRDLDALRDASLPLAAERGRGGGYALDRSYSLPPVNFTAREAALLVALGRFAIDMRLMPFTDTLESALDKVRSALSTSAQRDLLVRLKELAFSGVPALPVKKGIRSAVERVVRAAAAPHRVRRLEPDRDGARHRDSGISHGSARNSRRRHRPGNWRTTPVPARSHHPCRSRRRRPVTASCERRRLRDAVCAASTRHRNERPRCVARSRHPVVVPAVPMDDVE